jgi:hypothetical protein
MFSFICARIRSSFECACAVTRNVSFQTEAQQLERIVQCVIQTASSSLMTMWHYYDQCIYKYTLKFVYKIAKPKGNEFLDVLSVNLHFLYVTICPKGLIVSTYTYGTTTSTLIQPPISSLRLKFDANITKLKISLYI